MKNRKHSGKRPGTSFALAALLIIVGSVGHTAPVDRSFPDHPLITGATSVPPNLIFILDDSGSMRSLSMGKLTSDSKDITNYPSDDNWYSGSPLSDNPRDRSYVNNTIYYNPNSQPYQPWIKHDGSRYPDASVTAVSPSTLGLNYEGSTSWSKANLVGNFPESVFYLPKPNVTDPGTSVANFDKYWIQSVGGIPKVVKEAEERQRIYSGSVSGINKKQSGTVYHKDYTVVVPEGTSKIEAYLSGGDGNGEIWIRNPANNSNSCTANSSGGNEETCVLDSNNIGSGSRYIRIRNHSTTDDLNGAHLEVFVTYPGVEEAGFSGRNAAQEAKNFANWYEYHRSRMKVAKAGASEAFSQLGENYRVGFDSIWNRSKGSTSAGSVSGDMITMPIPVTQNAGLFKGSNRQDWFSYLQGSNAADGTPLHGALQRSGKYLSTYAKSTNADPWGTGNKTDKALSCRASYAILTTDGYWNSNSGFKAANGSTGAGSETLAQIASRYYDTDLRSDIDDNVPADDQGNMHQRMTVFGVSIGLKGTLDGPPSAPPSSWPNPWTEMTGSGTAWNNETAKRIDDLWHAAVNTRNPNGFIVASDSERFASALTDAFKAIDGRQASGSNLASNGPQVTAGSAKFSAIYHSSEWWGDLRMFPRNVTNSGYSDTAGWKLSDKVNADPQFASGRAVLTSTAAAKGVGFVNTYKSDARFARAGVTAEDNLKYIRGYRVGEDGVRFRKRSVSPIGDIVNSSPAYVNDSRYLFVGANDGMLHSIDSSTGKVGFSYVPKGLDMDALSSLSKPDYQHRFFVDGQISVNKIRTAGDKNYLVAALGRGGKGVFALDVTNPSTLTSANVLWDATFQAGGNLNMGYVLGNPMSVTLQSGKKVALVPNGLHSEVGDSALFVYDLEGSGVSVLNANTAGGDNGLMVIQAADFNADGKVDVVYGGDINGNVWRWDFRTTNTPVAKRIFTAESAPGKPQAITGGLTVSRDGAGRIFVAFGTGRMISETDLPWVGGHVPQRQTIYGIIDNMQTDGTQVIQGAAGATSVRFAELQQRTFPFWGKDSKGRDARSGERYNPLPTTARGWYLDLGVPTPFATGERVVSSPVAAGRALWIDSIWPTEGDGCEASTGNGFMNAMDIFTGTNPSNQTSSGNTTGDGTFTFIDVDANTKGDDRLVNPTGGGVGNDPNNYGEFDGFITSVAHGRIMGRPDVSDKEVCTQLDDGSVVCVARTPAGGGSPKRLIWRELFRGG